MAINPRNLYNVSTDKNQTKRLTHVSGYNKKLFEHPEFQSISIDVNDPTKSKIAVVEATKRFSRDIAHSEDTVSALEVTHKGASLADIILKSTPNAEVRLVVGTYGKSEQGDSSDLANTIPPIKIEIGEKKTIDLGDEIDFTSTTSLFVADAKAVIKSSLKYGNPGLVLIFGYGNLIFSFWGEISKILKNESFKISRFPITMTPDTASLGLEFNRIPIQYNVADVDRKKNHTFYLTYKPYNIDIVSLTSSTKIVLPETGPNNPFTGYSQNEVDEILYKFYNDVLNKAKLTAHAQLKAACENYLKPSTQKKNEDDILAYLKASNDNITLRSIGAERDAQVQDVERTKVALKEFWASITIVTSFLEVLNDQLNSIFDPESVAANRDKNTTMGVFFNKYDAYFQAYYGAIKPSDTRKKKNAEAKLKGKKDETLAKASLSVTDNLAQLERDFNRLQAESQIIRVSGTGVNMFTHPDFDKTMSILDILRDEQPYPSFEKTIAVEETSGEQTVTSSDSATACNNVLKTIPKTILDKMKQALAFKKGLYLKKMFANLFSLKRIQNDPSFKVIGFFSGFGGINFSQFSSLSFDVGDFDAEKFRDAFRFSELKNQINGVLGVIDGLTPFSMSNRYLSQLNGISGIWGAADKSLSLYLSKFAFNFDFGKFLKNATPDDLRRCPSIPQIKSEILNSENSTNFALDKQKEGLSSAINKFNAEVNSIENLTNKLASIDAYTKLLNSNLSSETILTSPLPSLKQKASAVGLGTSFTDNLVNVIPKISNIQTKPEVKL